MPRALTRWVRERPLLPPSLCSRVRQLTQPLGGLHLLGSKENLESCLSPVLSECFFQMPSPFDHKAGWQRGQRPHTGSQASQLSLVLSHRLITHSTSHTGWLESQVQGRQTGQPSGPGTSSSVPGSAEATLLGLGLARHQGHDCYLDVFDGRGEWSSPSWIWK